MPHTSEITRLIEIMARLRDPVSGCPWDQVQTFHDHRPTRSRKPHEVAEAEAGDP